MIKLQTWKLSFRLAGLRGLNDHIVLLLMVGSQSILLIFSSVAERFKMTHVAYSL